jgi:hypothetical protein
MERNKNRSEWTNGNLAASLQGAVSMKNAFKKESFWFF